jgi:hypothetical protein
MVVWRYRRDLDRQHHLLSGWQGTRFYEEITVAGAFRSPICKAPNWQKAPARAASGACKLLEPPRLKPG